MNKYFLMLAAAGLIAVAPSFAQAEDAHGHDATASEATASADVAAEAAVEVKELELADGTKVVVEGDAVSVVDAEGNKTPAPDGEHTLKDGSKVTTKDGKLVK
jgi:hypothetical protein